MSGIFGIYISKTGLKLLKITVKGQVHVLLYLKFTVSEAEHTKEFTLSHRDRKDRNPSVAHNP